MFKELSRQISDKLISSVDYLRESVVGTLRRCLERLEDSVSGDVGQDTSQVYNYSSSLSLVFSPFFSFNFNFLSHYFTMATSSGLSLFFHSPPPPPPPSLFTLVTFSFLAYFPPSLSLSLPLSQALSQILDTAYNLEFNERTSTSAVRLFVERIKQAFQVISLWSR